MGTGACIKGLAKGDKAGKLRYGARPVRGFTKGEAIGTPLRSTEGHKFGKDALGASLTKGMMAGFNAGATIVVLGSFTVGANLANGIMAGFTAGIAMVTLFNEGTS